MEDLSISERKMSALIYNNFLQNMKTSQMKGTSTPLNRENHMTPLLNTIMTKRELWPKRRKSWKRCIRRMNSRFRESMWSLFTTLSLIKKFTKMSSHLALWLIPMFQFHPKCLLQLVCAPPATHLPTSQR